MARRVCGVNIPLFSLRSKKSMGVGDFFDLISLIDWAKEAGLKIIQLLPINDTSSATGCYPYSIRSGFALNPIYMHIQELAPEKEKEIFAPFIEPLNLPNLDYEKTYRAKIELLRMLFVIRGEQDLNSKDFAQFFKSHKEHIKPYAAFCVLSKKHGTDDFSKWGEDHLYSALLVDQVCETEEARFHYFVQYHLDRQLALACDHAKKKHVRLKGDFPMGVDPKSVEAWRFYEYFLWDRTMGAPPDFYNAQGQNWGFPPYNWDEIAQEKYFYLTARLKWMEQYFDMVRIDHVLGYFRLWHIPKEEKLGLMGHFVPSIGYSKEELAQFGLTDLKSLTAQHGPVHEDRILLYRDGAYHPRVAVEHTRSFAALASDRQKAVLQMSRSYFEQRQEYLWEREGKEKLQVMQKATSMEICVEDIGVIPTCVGQVLKELDLPNLYLQRMPKSFSIEYEEPSKDFPERCVCTPSNHDTSTLRGFWEEDPEKTARYYNSVLKGKGPAPSTLTQELAEQIVAEHLESKARYAIFLLQDLFALDPQICHPDPKVERINDPSDPQFHWGYRMHLYLEELSLAKGLTEKIRTLVKRSGR